jgi:hypothetical protein
MSTRDRRMKATDVFAKTDFLFGKTSDFSKAFPTIEHANITVVETGEGSRGREQHYSENRIGEYVDCHNPLCYNGGVRIGDILRLMELQGKTEFECDEWCQGYEGSPKGRKKYGPCDTVFHIKIVLSCRPK